MAKKGGKQPGAGKPKKIIPKEDLERAGKLALEGAKNNTICTLMDWDHNLIEQREDIKKYLSKKRAERKMEKQRIFDSMVHKFPGVAVFMAKNELEMSDRQEIHHSFEQIKIAI